MTPMKNTSSSMISDDSTIVAIATPAGVGAISIVRLSGKQAYSIALSLTHRISLKPRYAHLCLIYDESGVPIDEALALYFPNPQSYTAEDVCEIQCHGGFVSARAIMELCVKYGARLAKPGEFTKRAFLNGRLDLCQAQAVSKLIHSQSLEANKILLKQLKGDLGLFVENLRERLLDILAFVEVNIDYSEEIEDDYTHTIASKLKAIAQELQKIYTFSSMRQNVLEGYRLSLIGKPNVGKSSLLNALLMYERAIVSEVEGTTRDTIEENLILSGSVIRLVDTAGIRQSEDMIEQIGIAKSKDSIQQSDIILALFDGSKELDGMDMQILELLRAQDKYLLVLVNKSDLPIICDLSALESLLLSCTKALSPTPLFISAKSGDIAQILKILEEMIIKAGAEGMSECVMLTSSYQLECVKKALDSIQSSYPRLESGELELFSYHIKESIESICSLTRPYDISEFFDKLFGEFCLGK